MAQRNKLVLNNISPIPFILPDTSDNRITHSKRMRTRKKRNKWKNTGKKKNYEKQREFFGFMEN